MVAKVTNLYTKRDVKDVSEYKQSFEEIRTILCKENITQYDLKKIKILLGINNLNNENNYNKVLYEKMAMVYYMLST